MTVQLDIDERKWIESQTLAKELDVDYSEVLVKALRASLYSLRREKQRRMTVEEIERQHHESYKKYPVRPDEFFIEEEQLEEVWKDL